MKLRTGTLLRPVGLGAYVEVPPYKLPLSREVRVVPRAAKGISTPLRWPPNSLAWLEGGGLDVPEPVQAAIDAFVDCHAETFTPSREIAESGVRSLVAEARLFWHHDHKARQRHHLKNISQALIDAAAPMYGQCRAEMAQAVIERDDATWAAWRRTASKIAGWVGYVEGIPPGSARRAHLDPWSPWWVARRPDLLHDLDLKPSASVFAEHPDTGPGLYEPGEVLAHLVALGARTS